ncbi:hypothetical protein As57867_005860, partial [Aphanomyces stellatus]
PRPAPAPAPAPAPRPAPGPAPGSAPRPAPGPAPRPGSAPNGPRPPPAAPVPRPAVVPSPVAYRPVTQVAYVQPTYVRPIVYAPVGYMYYPVYVHPIYYWRPYVYIYPVYWNTNTCYQNYCTFNYNRCMATFGDACFCYPGLLRCLQTSCYSYYQPAYDQCNQARNLPARCVLSCNPAPYPLAATGNQALLPGTVAFPNPVANGTANGTNTTTTLIPTAAQSTVYVVQYSVVAIVLLQGTNSSELPDAEYDFAGAVATSLAPAKAAVVRDNVTLSYRDVVVNSTAFVEVTIGVAVPSADAMNATDAQFQGMMYGNITNGTLGQTLKDANVLFNASQLSFDDIRSNVYVADPYAPTPAPTGVAPSVDYTDPPVVWNAAHPRGLSAATIVLMNLVALWSLVHG